MKRLSCIIIISAAAALAIAAVPPCLAQSAPAAAAHTGGVIDISPAFADWLQPYVISITNLLLSMLVAYVVNWLRAHWKINMDDKQRAAVTMALQNQAGSLIAAGKVKISGGKIDVGSDALAAAAADLLRSVPQAAQHFGLTPDFVASRIVAAIPQIAAGAALIAQHAAAQIYAAPPAVTQAAPARVLP